MDSNNSNTEVEDLKRAFLFSLRRKYPRDSSSAIAISTVNLMRKIIFRENPRTMPELQVLLANHCRQLHAAERSELIIINIGLMISKLARDEVLQKKGGSEPEPLYTLWRDDEETTEKLKKVDMKKVRKDLQQSIKELSAEIESSRECIAQQSTELIFHNDTVMVHGVSGSKTMQAFISHANKSGRKHRVIDVIDSSIDSTTPDFVTPIELDEVASKMPETSKVVLVAVAYFPDGSCLVPIGGHQIALLAKRHCVPVYVLAPFYKLSPFFMTQPAALHTFRRNPLPFELSASAAGLVDCVSPAFDSLRSDLVTLFVSNTSCIIPSHVNRLKEDYFNSQDVSEF